MRQIVLGGGCFWCTEAVFQAVDGAKSVTPGYAGGTTQNPTYDQVITGETGHAEVVKVEFDETVVPLQKILEIFFATHDPTSLNRQGADVGTQYRSIILYSLEGDKAIIQRVMEEIQESLGKPVVTEVKQLDVFYDAEDYHHDYFKKNPQAGYCQAVIEPKLAKLRSLI